MTNPDQYVGRRLAILVCLVGICSGCQQFERTGYVSLWQIDSGSSRIYLLGTVHALQPADHPLPQVFQQAYDRSDAIVVEVDIGKLGNSETQKVLSSLGYFQSGETLMTQVSDKTFELFQSYVMLNHLDMATYQNTRPWLIGLQVSMGKLRRLGYDPELGVDQHFLKQAAGNKRILELETFAQQMAFLANDDPVTQDLALRSTLEGLPQMDKDLKRLIQAWRAGDMNVMFEISTEALARYPQLLSQYKKLVTERNQNMTMLIEQWLGDSGTYLVMVGALHLGGSDGILRALSGRYPITQIRQGELLQ